MERLRAVLYVPSDMDDAFEYEVRAHQMTRLSAVAREYGFEVVMMYSDIDTSTYGQLNRMIFEAQQDAFDVILAMDLERLLRGTRFAIELREKLLLGELHLVTLDGLIDTFSENVYKIGLYDWLYEAEELEIQNNKYYI